MFSSIILSAAILSGFSYIVYQVASFSFLTKYSKRWLEKQANPIREEMRKMNTEVIKIPLESWNEISLGYERLNSKFSLRGIEVGVVKSIYYENLILTGKKKQLGNPNKYILLAFVDDIEVILIATGKEVTVFINEKNIGKIQPFDLSYQSSIGVKAFIQQANNGQNFSLVVNNKKVCTLSSSSELKNPFSTRLIEYIDPQYQEEFVRAMPLIIYFIMKDL